MNKNSAPALNLVISPEKLTPRLADITEELCQIVHLAEFASMAIKKASECESGADVTLSYGEVEGLIGVMDSFISGAKTAISELSDLGGHIEFPDFKWGIHKETAKQ
jgi:hypothetical protein